MRGKWYRTNEKENAIDYLETAAAFKTSDHRHKWKWVTIALHGALYGAAILAVMSTDPDRVLDRRRNKRNKGNADKLIGLWRALELCERDDYMQQYVGSKRLVRSDSEKLSIQKLSDDFRNNFEHFSPKAWSIEITHFPVILRDVCRTIHFLFFESGNVRLTSSQRKRIAAALRKLKRY